MNSALLQKTCDVFFGAGGPSERRAVVHQLSGHDERVSPLQLTVISLTVMMDPKATFKHQQLVSLHREMVYSCVPMLWWLRNNDNASNITIQ